MGWHEAAREDEVSEDEGMCVTVGGHKIALFKYEGAVYAIDNTCTHAQAELSLGFVDGGLVECPLHQACFDIRTGKVVTGPATEDVCVYPVRVENGVVLIET